MQSNEESGFIQFAQDSFASDEGKQLSLIVIQMQKTLIFELHSEVG